MVNLLYAALIIILIFLVIGLTPTDDLGVTLATSTTKIPTPLSSLPIVIINLDRKPERYRYVSEQLDSLGLNNYRRISAVDGFQISDDEFRQFGLTDELIKRRGIAGCAASHVKVWRHIVENKLEQCLVLEDDAHFHPEFMKLFHQYRSQVPNDYKIMYPGYCTDENDLPANKAVVQKSVLCTQSYIVSWQGAQYLLDNLLPIADPIDIAIDNHFKHHSGSYIFNGNVTIDGIRPNDYKEANGRRCMFNGIIYQNHEEQGSTIHQYDTVY